MPITDEMVEAALDAHERTAGSRRDLMHAALAAAYPFVVAECAAVAGAWKSSLQPGALERLAGHEEAARDIKRAILALTVAQQEAGR